MYIQEEEAPFIALKQWRDFYCAATLFEVDANNNMPAKLSMGEENPKPGKCLEYSNFQFGRFMLYI